MTVSLWLAAVVCAGRAIEAQGAALPYVTPAEGAGRFPLVAAHRATRLVVSPADFVGVQRAARDLAGDLGHVSGGAPAITVDSEMPAKTRTVIVAGTLGHNAFIDGLVRDRKLDVSRVAGRWETFLIQIVEKPTADVDHALIIAGSDKRGTIYGLYDVSSSIGVSPWTWWADVPVRRQPSLYVLPGAHSDGEPAVKYRGIFLNDEAPALSGWAKEKFGGINHKFYEKVFELILRLKGNYLWPAMWGNAFNDDDKVDPQLADDYGIVMGTSHHEPMLRAQQEWKRYGKGEWNYEKNDSTLRAFWADGIKNMGKRESIVTVGMRGDGDTPMTTGSNIDLLERIVHDQRDIIASVTDKPASQTPQDWALYKEVQDYYDKGMRVPDDVTLLFSDDNWGNIRRLPARADTARSGGFGIYYHFDYVGGPRNYKWINTNPIGRVWEQMHLAYEYGARRIWIVNVGDLKPMEFPISFFLTYAWNPNRIPAASLPAFTRRWAAQQFGSERSTEIGEIITKTLDFAGRRKPELLDTLTYSLRNYREAERVVAAYDSLLSVATKVEAKLTPTQHDAYYELVLHPIEAAGNLNKLYVTVARNRMYAAEGRAATNTLADSARRLFDHDAEITRYYNTKLAGGKWNHMMDQTHIGYTYWQEPPRNTMPRVDSIVVPARAEMGVAVVEQNSASSNVGQPGGMTVAQAGAPGARELSLAPFDAYTRPTYHVDVYDRGKTPFAFTASAAQPWVKVSPAKGTITTERRLAVSVDWKRAPVGTHRVAITITGPKDSRIVVQAPVENPASPTRDAVSGFIESGGLIAIDAEHFSREVAPTPFNWLRVPSLGKTGAAITPIPVTSASVTPGGNTPRLEYDLFMFDSGSVQVHAYLSPTLNFTNSASGLRYAVSIDDEPPQIVRAWTDTSQRGWERAVANDVLEPVSSHTLTRPGRHVLKFWMVDPGVVLQRLVVSPRPIPPSYLGPPESFNRWTPTKQSTDGGGREGSADGDVALAPPGARRTPPLARFDWFDYQGHDSVYTTLARRPDQFFNPILAGFYPDPSITRAGDAYYLVTSSFVYFPGVPIFRSTDLVHWTQIGSVLDRPSQLHVDSAGISRGIFAPVIRYHDGTFYMITTLIDRGGNFIVTATNPAGPWSDPIWLREVDGIDPSIFFDDDGRAYITNNGPPIEAPLYEGHRAIWIQEYDVANKKMVGPRSVIVNGGVDIAKKPIWIEAPHILKVKGQYYLICAEGGTADQHSEVVFRASSPRGPYTAYDANPILTQRHLDPSRAFPVTSTGHADLVETQNGEWWAVFLGTRPYANDTYNIGRETFLLPVRWENGWPVILSGKETVPYALTRPKLPVSSASIAMGGGNFDVRDDFSGATLANYWTFMRTVRQTWYDLTSRPGWLTIQARGDDISGPGQPSFVGRRQQHIVATASTAMRFDPERPGDKAGLVAFQNETHHYFIGVARSGDSTVIRVEMSDGARAKDSVLASAPLGMPAGGTVFLKIDARGGRYDFSFGRRAGEWIPLLRDADGTILSTKHAGGFVGTMLGMYAYASP
ncbi:MAG TPA: glycosyl hydrolase 115 family protein [Gemmatimonadaceae bacterium]|nr:glycosyl hydrolase 115 family protein [Gemmatimonadaceae bacterium]